MHAKFTYDLTAGRRKPIVLLTEAESIKYQYENKPSAPM